MLKEKAKQAGMSDSAYIRFLISQKPGDHVQIRKLLKDLISEVNYIGHNINQIVKSYHEHFYRKEDKTRLFAYMRKLLETVNEAVDTIDNQ